MEKLFLHYTDNEDKTQAPELIKLFSYGHVSHNLLLGALCCEVPGWGCPNSGGSHVDSLSYKEGAHVAALPQAEMVPSRWMQPCA